MLGLGLERQKDQLDQPGREVRASRAQTKRNKCEVMRDNNPTEKRRTLSLSILMRSGSKKLNCQAPGQQAHHKIQLFRPSPGEIIVPYMPAHSFAHTHARMHARTQRNRNRNRNRNPLTQGVSDSLYLPIPLRIRLLQDGFKMVQDGPKMAQKGPKRAPKKLKTSQDRPRLP